MSRAHILSKEFLERINSGKSIKYKDFREDNSLLLSRIEKCFGSITKCAEYCGITQEELISKYGMGRNVYKGILDDDEIMNRLLYLKSINKLNTNNMRTQFDDIRLENALKTKYGSVQKALDELGL